MPRVEGTVDEPTSRPKFPKKRIKHPLIDKRYQATLTSTSRATGPPPPAQLSSLRHPSAAGRLIERLLAAFVRGRVLRPAKPNPPRPRSYCNPARHLWRQKAAAAPKLRPQRGWLCATQPRPAASVLFAPFSAPRLQCSPRILKAQQDSREDKHEKYALHAPPQAQAPNTSRKTPNSISHVIIVAPSSRVRLAPSRPKRVCLARHAAFCHSHGLGICDGPHYTPRLGRAHEYFLHFGCDA